jgi:hypothetical protein
MSEDSRRIDAMPTKALFVEMLTRDISLDRAVLDLVDNCIDGAKRLREAAGQNFDDLEVNIEMSNSQFRIHDNCGGFSVDTAVNYAFRFGRATEAGQTKHSIGQFGVGMKRALFKFGRMFEVRSKVLDESWSVIVNVDEWEANKDWSLKFDEVNSNLQNLESETGTSITVTNLRSEVASKFGSESFHRTLQDLIRVHHRQFIANGLTIKFNGSRLTATGLTILVGDIAPAVERFSFPPDTEAQVEVKIVAGLGPSQPTIAGWYIVCNGRVVLAADRSDVTGWGLVAEQLDEIPKYHNQYSRFRGVAYFESEDASLLPWNTTKTGVDLDAPIWRFTISKMVSMARSVIDFLNELDREKDEAGQEGPLHRAVQAANVAAIETVSEVANFRSPDRDYGVTTAKAVGERSFDTALKTEGE